eukprot:7755204-Karenia_brevis.AAC.1
MATNGSPRQRHGRARSCWHDHSTNTERVDHCTTIPVTARHRRVCGTAYPSVRARAQRKGSRTERR